MKRAYVNGRRTTFRRRGRTRSLIPVEFGPLLDSYHLEDSQRIELWSYALVLLMLDEGQVRKVGAHHLAERDWITVQILTGEQFDVVRPPLDDEEEARLLEGVRQIVGKARRARRRRGRGATRTGAAES